MNAQSVPLSRPGAHGPTTRGISHGPWSALAILALAFATSGCATRHTFDLESIHQSNSPDPQRSYRLVDARPDARPGDLRFARVARDVQTALSCRGLFAAPEGTTPELIVEVDYGISAPITRKGVRREPFSIELPGSTLGGVQSRDFGGSRVTQPVYLGEREVPFVIKTYAKFLRLTARESEPATPGAAPRQFWSVFVTNEDDSDNLPHYTRLMIAAAMDNVGEDFASERRIVLTRGDRRVTFVEAGLGSS